MEKPLSLPDEYKAMIKQHLGKKALAIQKSGQPLGLWLITSDSKARYIPFETFLKEFVVSMPADERQWFLDEMEQLDEDKEVMVVLSVSDDLHFTSRVNLVDED
jgi:hypothetical protein